MPLGMTYATHRKPYMLSTSGTTRGRISGTGSVRTGGGGGGTVTARPRLSDVSTMLTKDYRESRAEQQARYKTGIGELTEAAGLFGPEYTAGMEHAALTGARQSLIGRGLGGTTRPMAVGAGMKAHFEGLRRGKLADALARIAEYRRTSPQIYPQAGTLANLALGAQSAAIQQQGMFQAPTVVGGVGSVGGPAYQAFAQSLAQPFISGSVSGGGVTDIGTPDFSLPTIQTAQTTQQQPAFDWTGYRTDIAKAGQGNQRIIGAPEWMQPYNQA